MHSRKVWNSLTKCICLAIVGVSSLADAVQPDKASGRPNILLAIADDWSYGHAGAYGCKWADTPGFDRVAREGLLFTHAYTPNAKCAPSRACLLTGRNSWQLKEAANHICFFPAEFKSYAEALAENGYFVGKTTKGWGPGVAKDADGKNREMAGRPFEARKMKPPAAGIANSDYAGNFEDFLNAAPENAPWCFWYGSLEPHRGYEFGAGVAKGGKKLADIEHVPAFWPDNEVVRNDMLDYGFEVEYFDSHLVQMLKLLDEKGELENTIVVVTSDHGMPFPRAKGQAYEYSNHVPLAIRWPKGMATPGRVVDDYVSFADLAPTFIELAGLSWENIGMQPTPGRSLTDIFSSSNEGRVNDTRDHVLVGKERHDIGRPHDWGYPIRGIFKGDMLYVHNFETSRWPAGNPETGYLNCDGGPTKTEVLRARTRRDEKKFWDLCFGKRTSEELYNVKNDPDCLQNLADSPAYQIVKEQLKQQLFDELKNQGDPRMLGQAHIFDEYVYASPDTRNFYERYMRGEPVKAGWVSPSDFEQSPLDDAE